VAPRAAGRQADTDLSGELGMCDSHEGCHLFVPDLDELDLAGTLKGSNHAVDSVAGISVDPPDAPCVQAFNNEIADFHGKTPVVAGMRSRR
jgi:hypothetical protein